jgi:hypothetical protein
LKVGSAIRNDCVIQGYFDGDNYFDKAVSNTIHYDIVKHRTGLNLKLDNLKLNLGSGTTSSLDSSQKFRITGSLVDLESSSPLVGEYGGCWCVWKKPQYSAD